MEEIDCLVNSENISNTDWNEIALYKISKLCDLDLPPPDIHTYLAGTIQRFQESDDHIFSPNIIHSTDELNELLENWKDDRNSKSIIYSVARSTGDFYLNSNAFPPIGKDIPFLIECYKTAETYGTMVGRPTEPKIFHVLSQEPERYIKLLSIYYQYPNLEITDDDFRDFNKDVKQLGNIQILLCPIEIVKPSKKLSKIINGKTN